MARRAFVIGSNGSAAYGKLKYAERDAAAITTSLASRGCEFEVRRPAQTVKPFPIIEELTDAIQQCDENDVFVCYFSGHGELYKGKLFLILDDSRPGRELGGTAIDAQFVTTRMAECAARNKLLILDCCHAAAAGPGAKKANTGADVQELGFDSKNHLTLYASGRLETTREFDELEGSFLTKSMCSILTSPAQQTVTLKGLLDELRVRAKQHNERSELKVPLPYMHGDFGGDLFLRMGATAQPQLTFTGVERANVLALVSSLFPYEKWDPEFLRNNLPLLVMWPRELQSYVDQINEYVASDAWPGRTTDDAKERFRAVPALLPSTASSLVIGVARIISLSQRKYVGAEHLSQPERDRLLETYVHAKAVALIRFICSNHPRNSASPETWMADYFHFAPEFRHDIIVGLPSVLVRETTRFWTDVDLAIAGTTVRIFLPDECFLGNVVAPKRTQILDIVFPQLLDHERADAMLLTLLQTPEEAVWRPCVSAVINVDSFQIATSRERIKAAFGNIAMAMGLKQSPLSARAAVLAKFPSLDATAAALLDLSPVPPISSDSLTPVIEPMRVPMTISPPVLPPPPKSLWQRLVEQWPARFGPLKHWAIVLGIAFPPAVVGLILASSSTTDLHTSKLDDGGAVQPAEETGAVANPTPSDPPTEGIEAGVATVSNDAAAPPPVEGTIVFTDCSRFGEALDGLTVSIDGAPTRSVPRSVTLPPRAYVFSVSGRNRLTKRFPVTIVAGKTTYQEVCLPCEIGGQLERPCP